MNYLFSAKVYDLSDDEIYDIYLHRGEVWFHSGNVFEKAHYHVAKYSKSEEDFCEFIYSLCDKIVIPVILRKDEWDCFVKCTGYKIYPRITDDFECVEE